MLWVNIALLTGSVILWLLAAKRKWLDDVVFVSHISMAALVYAAIAGIAAASQ